MCSVPHLRCALSYPGMLLVLNISIRMAPVASAEERGCGAAGLQSVGDCRVLSVHGEGGWLYSRQQNKLQQMSAIRKNIISSALASLVSTFVFSQVAFLIKCVHQTVPMRESGPRLSCKQFIITKRYAKCSWGCLVQF